MDQIDLLQPEFVINVGDLIEGYPRSRVRRRSRLVRPISWHTRSRGLPTLELDGTRRLMLALAHPAYSCSPGAPGTRARLSHLPLPCSHLRATRRSRLAPHWAAADLRVGPPRQH
jgi:hypothetical protein